MQPLPRWRGGVRLQTFDVGLSLPAHLEKHAPERTTEAHTKAGGELN